MLKFSTDITKNIKPHLGGLMLALLLCTLSATASVNSQRQLFNKLYSLALAGNDSLVAQQRSALQGYAIEHYLDYALIRSRMSQLPEQDIADFNSKHPDSPLNKKLKEALISALGNQGKWSQYLNHYLGFGQGKKQCWFLRAKLETNQTQGLAPMAESMWLTGLSAPDACNPVFKWWQQAGHMTDDLIIKRIKLAFESNNFSLIEYLKRQLKHKPVWVEHAIDLIKDSAQTLLQSTQWQMNPENPWLIFKTSLRLAQKQPAELFAIWPKIKAAHAMTPSQQLQVERTMALFAATDYEPFSIDAMNQLPADMKDDQIKAWIVRYHLFHEDWPAVAHALKQMPARLLETDRWRYWQARAEAKLGNKALAKKLFGLLSSKTNYYGFLAADHLRLPYQLCQKPSNTSLNQFTPPAGIQRAIELHHAGLLSMARSEWNLAYRSLNKDEKIALADMVTQEGWYAKSIAIMADLGQWENYQLRYPFAHQQIIQKHADSNNPLPQWVMAIIKQESAWTKDAVSHANAHGLMQLLPSTAKQLAQQMGININQNNQLHQAPLNIQLGVQYQKNLFKQFDHPLLVAAAYNAGESKSIDWSIDFPKAPDIWLETIPYKETRNYVTKILSNVTIYDWLTNQQPKRMSYWMPTMPINLSASKLWPNPLVSQQKAPVQCSP